MPLILENVLIRKKDNHLPQGASGYVVRLPSVFLSMLSDGTEIRGTLTQGTREQQVTLILEKGTGEDMLHIAAEDWNEAIKEGRADFKLTEASRKGKMMRIYAQRDIITSPAHSCKISPKR
jgi:hypothetical protein